MRISCASVSMAALSALGSIGDASSVAVLTKAIATGGPAGKAAAGSLTNLKGDDIGTAIVKALSSDNKDVRTALLTILAARSEKAATPAVIAIAGSDKESTIVLTGIR